MMWWPTGQVNGWGWFAMTISMVLFWALVVGVGALLVRAVNRPPAGPSTGARPSAQELLAERYARGELTDDEYRQRLEVLTGTGHPTPTR